MSVPIFQRLKFHHLIKMVLPDFSTVEYLFLFLICAECYFEIVSISCSLITIHPMDLASTDDSYVNHLLHWWIQNSDVFCFY